MSPNDFYAGAAAAFVVILLTKFLTHRTRRPEFQSKDNEDTAWWIGHWVCVIAAWLGLLLSLTVLAVQPLGPGRRRPLGHRRSSRDRRDDPGP